MTLSMEKDFSTNQKRILGSGSGVIISEDGYIITNRHSLIIKK